MKNYSVSAAALALGVSEAVFEGKKSVNIAEILTLSENSKLKRYNEEAEIIRKLLNDIRALEK